MDTSVKHFETDVVELSFFGQKISVLRIIKYSLETSSETHFKIIVVNL